VGPSRPRTRTGILPRSVRTTAFVLCLATTYYTLHRLRAVLPWRWHRALVLRAHRIFSAWFVGMAVDLKGAIIKIGQILSIRRDLMPPEWIIPLSRLQDEVESVPWDVLREPALSRLPALADLVVEPEALAAASYAQVHRARTPEGREVVLKVRHPGLEAKVRSDLRSSALAVRLLTRFLPGLDLAEAHGAIRESLLRELDFALEGKSLEAFRAQFQGEKWSWLGFPEVFWEYTCPHVLCLTYLPHPTLRQALPTLRKDRHEVFRRIARIWYHSVFHHGFFHADPHPGNILVGPENKLYLIDFGMMGRVDRKTAGGLRRLLAGLVDLDAPAMVEGYRRLGIVRTPADERLLQDLFEEFLAAFRHATPQSIGAVAEASRLPERSMDLVGQAEDLRFPHQVVLLFRAEGVVEGLAGSLLPDETLPEALAPSFADFRESATEHLRGELEDLWSFARSFPGEARRTLELLREGKIAIRTEDPNFGRALVWAGRLWERSVIVGMAGCALWFLTGFSAPTRVLDWVLWVLFVGAVFLLARTRP